MFWFRTSLRTAFRLRQGGHERLLFSPTHPKDLPREEQQRLEVQAWKTYGPVMDWILTSGLTQDEIAAIQEPFMPVYQEQPVVEPKLRAAENARLIKKYKQVTAMIVKNQKKSLELAVDRLMKNQELAWKLVNG